MSLVNLEEAETWDPRKKYVIMMFNNTEDRRKNLKLAQKRKKEIKHKNIWIRMTSDISIAALEAWGRSSNTFKVLKEILPTKNSIPSQTIKQLINRIKIFQDIQGLQLLPIFPSFILLHNKWPQHLVA